MVKKKRQLLLSVTSIALGAFLAMPQTLMADQLSIYYGGRLTNPSGVPVKGPVALQASFFHTETGGTAVGGVVVNFGTVTLTDGIFQIDISLTDEEWSQIFPSVSQKVYIQLENVTEPEVYPRQLYNIAPYALKVPVDNKTITYNNKGQLSLGSSLKIPAGSTGNYVELHANPASTDGTKYTLPVAPLANKFMTTDGSGILSWVDLPGGGTITGVTAGTGLTGGGTSATVTLNVDVGTTANKIVQLDGTGKLPAVDGSALTSVVAATITSQGGLATLNAVAGGTAGTITDNSITDADVNAAAAIATSKISGPLSSITGNGLGTAAALNVGVGSNNIPQLDFLGRLPALDGSALTNLPVQTPNWAVPGTIGSTTPNTGAFTTIAAGGAVISGTGPSGIPLAVAGAASQTAPLAEFRTNTGTVLSRIGSDGSLSLKDGDTNYATIRANNTMPADITFTLPPGAAGAGQFLTSDGSGNFNWGTPSGSGNMSTTTFDTNTDGRIDIAAGGTGATTPGDARIALGLGTAAEANTGVASGNVPVLGVGGTLPAVSGANLTNLNADNISAGTLPLARGGTGATTLTGVAVGNGTSPMTAVSGTANQYLRRNAGNTAYEFGSLGSLATLNEVSGGNAGTITDGTITNDDISASAAIADSKLATISTAGKVDDTALSANVTKLGNSIDVGSSEITGTLPVGNGGTGATTLTGIPVGNGTAAMSAITGTANQYLRRNSANNAYEFGDMPAANMTGLTTDMSFSGAQDRSVTVDRRTGAGQGRKFLIEAGEPALAETDTDGGTMSVSSGASTGSGSSFIEFLTATAGASGTADRAPTAKMTILGNGNVGIGTTSPVAKLDVNVVNGANARIFGGSNQAFESAGLQIQTGTNLAYEGGSGETRLTASGGMVVDGFNVQLKISGSEKMRIDNSGNVGIGTNNPDALVHAAKSVDGDSVALLLENSQSNAASSTNETTQMRFGFDGDNDAARILVGKVNDYTSAPESDSFMAFYTDRNGTATEAMRISNNGNVGIGTIVPDTTLQVTKTSASALTIPMLIENGTYQVGTAAGIGFRTNDTGSDFIKGSLAFERTAAYGAGKFHFLLEDDNNPTSVALADSKMTIDFNGRVGIGTNNPLAGLDVQVASGIRAYQICDEAGNNCKDLSAGWGSSGSISDSGNATAISIDASEKVGIGTGSPDQRLTIVDGGAVATNGHVLGVHADDGNVFFSAYYNDTFSTVNPVMTHWGDNSGNYAMGTHGANSFNIYTNGWSNVRMTIDAAGEVGIGTSNPSSALHVVSPSAEVRIAGSATNQELKLAFRDNNATQIGQIIYEGTQPDKYLTIDANGAAGGLRLQSSLANNTPILFYVNGGEKARLTATGSLGLGTWNPQSMLSVTGGAAIGTYAATNAAPTNGLIVSGNVGIGTNLPTAPFEIASAVSAAAGIPTAAKVSGSVTGTGVPVHGLNVSPTLVSDVSNSALVNITGKYSPTGTSGGYGILAVPSYSNSAATVGASYGILARVDTDADFTGSLTNAYGFFAGGPILNGANKISNYYMYYAGHINSAGTSNSGNTSGTINNYSFFALPHTASAGAGGTLNNYGQYITLSNGSGASGTTNNYGLFITGNSTGGDTNYAVYSDSTAASYLAGNVGIGTTSPDKVLVVSSTDVTPIRAHRQANSNGNVVSIIHSANDSGGNVTGYAATAAVIESATDGAENGAFTIQTTTAGASLEKLRITSAGNVGIGTTAPTGLLHVAANGAPETLLEAADASSFNSPTLTFSRAKGSLSSKSIVAMGDELLAIEAKGYDSGSYRKAAGIYMSVDGTPGASDMPGRIEFATTPDGSTTPAERMRIEENGYIGIGTNAPSKVLDINSDSIRVRTAKTPASSTAACDQGEIAWDANYIYVCRATNTWMRAAISTW